MSQGASRWTGADSRRTSLAGAVLSLIMGIAFVLVLGFVVFELRAEHERFGHSYSVSILPAHDDEYLIEIPVPTDYRGSLPHGFVDGVIVIDGQAELTVKSTDYGLALVIVGQGPANITWNDHWSSAGGWRSANLSMTVTQDGSDICWVYCDSGGVSISLRSMSTQSILDGMPRSSWILRTIDGDLTSAGWHLMPVHTEQGAGI